jgi:hypothetical protein
VTYLQAAACMACNSLLRLPMCPASGQPLAELEAFHADHHHHQITKLSHSINAIGPAPHRSGRKRICIFPRGYVSDTQVVPTRLVGKYLCFWLVTKEGNTLSLAIHCIAEQSSEFDCRRPSVGYGTAATRPLVCVGHANTNIPGPSEVPSTRTKK